MNSRREILEIDPTEVILHDIQRHPIGLFNIVAATSIIFIIYLGLVFLFVRNYNQIGITSAAANAATVLAMALGILIVAGGYVAVYVYRQNEMIVTNENIILINQPSLFNRKISQLNLAKIQDVTGHQNTFFETTLGYGTLSIETAGETQNFNFDYAPNPHIHAKHIIEAHEQFIKAHRKTLENPYTAL